jgi:hypothetical protein
MLRKRDVRRARKEKERLRDLLMVMAEATALPSCARAEWIPAARVCVPYAIRKLTWPSCTPQGQREFYRRNWHRIRANHKRYYQRTRAQRIAHSLAWQRKNRDKVNARRRELRAANPEPFRAACRRWARANRAKLNAYRRRRALLKASAARSQRAAA